MSVYRYSARKMDGGQSQRGEITADSAYQVRETLRRMDLLPLQVHAVGAGRSKHIESGESAARQKRFVVFSRGRRRLKLIELYENLAIMLFSGIPLVEALDNIARASKSKLAFFPAHSSHVATLCLSLAERLRQGLSLAEAMAEHEQWFASVDAALVRSAEQNGETARALHDLAEFHARRENLQNTIGMVLAYPALLLAFGVGVVMFLTTVTMPKLAQVLTQEEVALPAPTKLLLWLGNTLVQWWPLLVVLLICAAGFFVWVARTPWLANFRLGIPLLGKIILRSQLSAHSLLISRLLQGGIPLIESLTLAEPNVPNQALRSALRRLKDAMQRGGSAADEMSAAGIFETVYIRVIEIGEQAGELPSVLENIGARYRASADRLASRLTALLEPLVILILAAMIGFVVYAAVVPMLRLAQAI